MKQYLLAGGVVLAFSSFVYANNPFDINKNMHQIDAEDSMLLEALEEDSQVVVDTNIDEFGVKQKDKLKTEKQIHKKKIINTIAPLEELEEETKPIDNQKPKIEPIKVAPKPKKEDNQKKQTHTKQNEPKKIVQEVQQVPQKVKDVIPNKENNVSKKDNQVVEISTEPINKQLKPAEPPKKILKPVVDESVSLKNSETVSKEPKAREVKQEIVKKETKKNSKPKIKSKVVPSVADINITKEKEEAALRVQKELEEAIREVDMED